MGENAARPKLNRARRDDLAVSRRVRDGNVKLGCVIESQAGHAQGAYAVITRSDGSSGRSHHSEGPRSGERGPRIERASGLSKSPSTWSVPETTSVEKAVVGIEYKEVPDPGE